MNARFLGMEEAPQSSKPEGHARVFRAHRHSLPSTTVART